MQICMINSRISLREIDCEKFIDCLKARGDDDEDLEILIDCAERKCL
jgi:hypothetical protein